MMVGLSTLPSWPTEAKMDGRWAWAGGGRWAGSYRPSSGLEAGESAVPKSSILLPSASGLPAE